MCKTYVKNDLLHIMACRLALWQRPDGKFLVRQEKRMAARMKAIFRRQEKWVLENLRDVDFIDQNVVNPDITNFVDDIPYQDDLADQIILVSTPTLSRGAKKMIKKHDLGQFGISFSLENKEATAYLRGLKSFQLSNAKGNITGTTKKRIIDILAAASASGASYDETAALIQKQGKAGVFSRARAELIAVREIGKAYEKGNDIPIQEFMNSNPNRPVVKWWVTVGDDRVTELCQENEDAAKLNYSELFPSGDVRAPRNSNPRCRCHTEEEITPPKKS